MLDLSSIAFKVETKELDDAVSKLGDLQKAVSNLNKPLNASTLATEKLAQAQAKTAKEQSKAEESANKAAITQLKLEKATTASANAQAKLASSASQSTDKVSALQRKLENTYKDLAQGFTKGESSVLNYARTLGVAEEALKPIEDQLKRIGKLSSDPFDAAIGSIRSVTKEFEMMNHRSELASKGIILTAKQLKEYSRVADEVAAKVQSQGLDPTDGKGLADYNKGVERLQAKYLGLASSVSAARQVEQQHQQALKDAGKATDYLTREMNRAENALAGLNNEVAISSSNRLLRFKEGLIASGVATDVAAAKYQAYAKVIAETDKKRAAQQKSDEQSRINNLSRGLAPQISDVAVSLYGGMSPMTVLMQQGLQVRDLIQSSGVEAGKLNEVLKKTGADFIGTIGGTFKAVGGLATGFLQSAGSGITDFILRITGGEERLKALAKTSDYAAASVARFHGAISTAIGVTLASTVVMLTSLAVAMKQVIQEESALTKAINVTGLSMGLSKDAAVEYAKSFEAIGISQSKAISVITEMAKQGGFTKEAIQSVTKAALDLEKYAGISIETTVNNFAKFQDKPYEALLKVASATGLVTQAQLENIKSLENQGKQAEATAESIRIYGEVTQAQADLSKLSLSSIETLWIDVKSSISGAWEEIKNLARGESFVNLLSDAFKVVQTVVSTVWYSIKQLNTALGAAAAIAGAMLSGNMSGAIEAGKQFISGWKEAANNQQGYLDNLWKAADAQNNVSAGLKLTAQQLEKNVVQSKAQAEWEKLTGDLVDKKTKREEGALRIRNQGLAAGKSELEIQKAIAIWNEKNKDPKAKKDPIESSYNKAIKTFTNDANAATAAQEKYTKAQQDFLNVATSPEWNSYSDKQKQNIVAAAEEAISREKVVEQIKEQLKAQLELQKAWDATVKAQTALDNRDFDALAASDAKLALLDEELADLILQKAIYGELSVEQKKQIEYAKIKRDLVKELADIENKRSKGTISDDAAKELIENAYVAEAKKRQNIDQAIILENIKFEMQQREEIAMAFGESIADALFNGGKSGASKLKNWLKNELQTRITLQIQANVKTSMQDQGGVNQLIQAGSNFGSTLGTEGFGSALAGGSMDVGAFLYNNGFKDLGNTFLDVGNSLADFAPAINQAVGYLGAFNTALEGDYGAGIGEAIGFYFGGPMGAAIGKEIGSWLGLTDDSGTPHRGGYGGYSVAGGEVSGATLRDRSTSPFGLSDDAILPEANKAMVNTSKGIVSILDSTSKLFGGKGGYYAETAFADDSSKDASWGNLLIKDDRGNTKVNWNDSRSSRWAPREFADGEAGAKEYSQAITKDVKALLIEQTPDWADTMLNALGESTTLEDLGKVVTQIHMVNASLKVMGEASVAFAGMSSDMITTMMDKLGGAESTVATLSDYYNKYYTASERAAISQKLMNDQFKALGETVPSSVEGMRSMVDAAIASGNSGLAAELLKLSGGFYEVANAATEANQAVASERLSLEEKLLTAQGNTAELRRRELEKLDPANRALQQRIWALEDAKEAEAAAEKATAAAFNALKVAVEKEKSALNDRIKSIEATATALTSIFELLKDNVRELYAEVTATSNMQVQQAYAIISNARTTGVLPSQDVLSQAIGTVRGSFESNNYASKFEADRARLLLANDLAALQGFANEQLTEAQQQIKLIKDQIEQYDLILEHAETQINELRGINTSVLSITGAIDALTAAIIKEQEAADAAKNPTKKPDDNPFSTGIGGPGSAGPNPTAGRYENSVDYYSGINAIGSYYNSFTGWENPQQQYENIQAMYSQATSLDVSANQISAATGIPVSGIQQVLEDMGLPKLREFAVGTNYVPRDGLAYLHEGEAIVPKAYNPVVNSETSSSDEMQMLRYEVRAVASSTAKLTRIIERVIVGTNEGEALQVKTTV